MARKLDDLMAALPKERRQRVQARAMELATLQGREVPSPQDWACLQSCGAGTARLPRRIVQHDRSRSIEWSWTDYTDAASWMPLSHGIRAWT